MHESDHESLRDTFVQQAGDYLDLAQRHGLTLTQDGHRTGTLALAHDELGLLGPTLVHVA